MSRDRKRAPGEGSVHKRKDGRYEASRTIGYYEASGHPRRIRAYGRSAPEARAKLDAKIAELGGVAAAGTLPPSRACSLEDWATSWIAGKRSQGVSERTATLYRVTFDNYVLPSLGKRPLRSIRPAHIEDLLSRLDAQGLSGTSRHHIYTVLNGCLKAAVRLQMIHANPCAGVLRPKRDTPRMTVWTPEEVTKFLDHTGEASRLHALFYVALTTGARRGELFGLRWSDLDLVAGRMTIAVTRDVMGKESAPKTSGSQRTVTLSEDVVEVLEAHAQAQAEERRLAVLGGLWQESGVVFATQRGTHLDGNNLWHHYDRMCREAGVRKIRFHDLRHTHATLALRAGVPVTVVAERLGHADASVTLRVYAHVLRDMEQAGALPLAKLVAGLEAPEEAVN